MKKEEEEEDERKGKCAGVKMFQREVGRVFYKQLFVFYSSKS